MTKGKHTGYRPALLHLMFSGLFLLPVNSLVAQSFKSFSNDTASFPQELRSFMEKSLNEDEKTVMAEYLDIWGSEMTGGQYREDEVGMLNLLLLKKGRPKPHFINYISTRVTFSRAMTGEENFRRWQHGMKKLLADKNTVLRIIDQVNVNTGKLITGNILNESSSLTWKAGNADYVIDTFPSLGVRFRHTDLICLSQRDSSMLLGTEGFFDMVSLVWKGGGGKVNWQRAGYDPGVVFAELSDYTIDMSKAEYSADSVKFYYTSYLDEPLAGRLTDKAKFIGQPERATHPQFDSYADRITIEDLYENVDFEGGLSMQGSRLNGSGTRYNKAKIFIYRNDTLVLRASSAFFVFRPAEVNSRRTEVSVYIGNDSIYHPQIYFNFNIPTRVLSLMQTEDAMSKSPYYNSLHKVDMAVQRLSWKIDDPRITFTMALGSAIGNASFQSEDYFRQDHYDWLQGMDDNHPLFLIRRFSQWYYSEEFPATEFANWLGMPLEHVQQLLIRLAAMGFLYYNSETDEATIKDKLHKYVDASAGKIDYDVLNLMSQTHTPQANASLDLTNHDLHIFGVPSIFLSDSQNVVIYPDKHTITLKKNRDFSFNGRIDAGLFSFYGKDFTFRYDSFLVRMPDIDSLQLRIFLETDESLRPVVADINNLIEDASGLLEIDHPANKSGLRSDKKYPIFHSEGNCYVYYDLTARTDTVQVAGRDYKFKIEPFTVYNLDNFTREDVSLEGDFESKNILPTFAQTLIVKEDLSLGFDHDVPADGLPVYNGRARFFNKIFMSNKGLKGSGKLTYLTSTTWSDEFSFFSDSMTTRANQFVITEQREGTEYPALSSNDVSIRWFPAEDNWIARQEKEPFELYAEKILFRGKINLTSKGLKGEGRADIRSSSLSSPNFEYLARSFRADTSEFRLRASSGTGFSFETGNVQADINLDHRKGIFRSNDSYSLVKFPENQFLSYTEYFVWEMAVNNLVLTRAVQPSVAGATQSLQSPGQADRFQKISKFISTHPRQDSLNFYSGFARYDIGQQVIYAEQVPVVEVADALIFPYEGKVNIERNAVLQSLGKARIEIPHLAVIHHFFDATVNITGKKNYFGTGSYHYLDESGNAQTLFFDDIAVKSEKTVASGKVQPADSFYLNPYFRFTGDVSLEAGKQLLTFDGGAMALHNCPGLSKNYLEFSSEIDPRLVLIPVSNEPKATNNIKIFNNHFITNDSVHIYPAFLSARRTYSDNPVSRAEGFLYYDKVSGEYRITSREKMDNPDLPDNYMSFDRNYCRLYAEGSLNLGVSFGQLKINSSGNILYDFEEKETELNLALSIEFFFSQQALSQMAYDIKSKPGLPGVDMNNPAIRKSITSMVGTARSNTMYNEINLYGTYMQIPEEINKAIFLSHVRLRWNQPTNSYRSEGKIGIGNIGGTPVNALVDGHLEIQKKRSGDVIDLYLELDKNTFYYFGYTYGVMQSISSNEVYRKTLTDLNLRDRALKTRSGEAPYTYMIAVDRKLDMFLRRISRDNPAEEPVGDQTR